MSEEHKINLISTARYKGLLFRNPMGGSPVIDVVVQSNGHNTGNTTLAAAIALHLRGLVKKASVSLIQEHFEGDAKMALDRIQSDVGVIEALDRNGGLSINIVDRVAAGAPIYLDKVKPNSLYTHVNSGGVYELIGKPKPAGVEARALYVTLEIDVPVVYRCIATGALYLRLNDSMNAKMKNISKEEAEQLLKKEAVGRGIVIPEDTHGTFVLGAQGE